MIVHGYILIGGLGRIEGSGGGRPVWLLLVAVVMKMLQLILAIHTVRVERHLILQLVVLKLWWNVLYFHVAGFFVMVRGSKLLFLGIVGGEVHSLIVFCEGKVFL